MPQEHGGDRSIGERIAQHRKHLGLTQEGLAMRLFRSKSWVTKIERGERPLDSVRSLVDVARALGVQYGTSPASLGSPRQAVPGTMPSLPSGGR
jgi:transcriptional regulator with XRE-family HTH domain